MEPLMREWTEDELNASIAKLIPRRPQSQYVPPAVRSKLIQALTLRTTSNGTKHVARDDNGTLVVVAGAPTNTGGFIGRAGSITRNRKGRTSRKANGSRRYNDVDVDIVMYSAKSIV